MTRLQEICERRRESIRRMRREQPFSALRESALWPEARRPFAPALRRESGPIRFLAEIKRASPSAGPIRPGADPGSIAREYLDAGAAALSVLTEKDHFDGDPSFIEACRRAVPLPLLMKDFVVDDWMVPWARSLGADAILLIVAALDRVQLEEYVAAGRELELAILCEVHDERELDAALALDLECIGVNHRDLRTMEIDLDLSARLLPRVPEGKVRIAESGIRTRDDVVRMEEARFDAILVGEGLMRAASPGAELRRLRGDSPEGAA